MLYFAHPLGSIENMTIPSLAKLQKPARMIAASCQQNKFASFLQVAGANQGLTMYMGTVECCSQEIFARILGSRKFFEERLNFILPINTRAYYCMENRVENLVAHLHD